MRTTFGLEGRTVTFDQIGNGRVSWTYSMAPHLAWVAFSPDGRRIVSLDSRGLALTWDAVTGKRISKPMPIGPPRSRRPFKGPRIRTAQDGDGIAKFWPDGRITLICDPKGGIGDCMELWDATTGMPIGGEYGKVEIDEVSDPPGLRNWKSPMELGRNPLRGVALSPDGLSAMSVNDTVARLWNAETLEPTGERLSPGEPIEDFGFSPDGRTVFAVCRTVAQLWDATTAKPVGPRIEYGASGPVGPDYLVLAFSHDGRRLLTALKGAARLSEVGSGRPIGRPMQHSPNSMILAAAFSPDGRFLASVGSDAARLWDAATAQPLPTPWGAQDSVGDVAFSPDGRTMLTRGRPGVQDNAPARFWDAATGKPVGVPMPHPDFAGAATFSPDGRTLVTGDDQEPRRPGSALRLWDVATGTPVGRPMEHPAGVTTLAFSPDGRTLVTGSVDGLLRLWDVATGSPVGLPLDHSGNPRDFAPADRDRAEPGDDGGTNVVDRYNDPVIHPRTVALSPDGRWICSANGSTARLWDVAIGRPCGVLFHHPAEIVAVGFSPDSQIVVTGGGLVACLWDATTGKAVGRPMEEPERTVAWHADGVRAALRLFDVAFSPDGRTVLTAFDDASFRLWDAATGKARGVSIRRSEPVGWPEREQFDFSPDGRWIVTGESGSQHLWNADSGELIGRPMANRVMFLPGAGSVLEIFGGSAQVRDLRTSKPVGRPMSIGPETPTSNLIDAISPDGRTLLFGALNDGAPLWDLSTGQPRGPILPHPSPPGSHYQRGDLAAFSPTGQMIVTTDGGNARLWDAASGRLLGRSMEHPASPGSQGPGIRSLTFSPDGLTLLTVGDSEIQLWDAITCKALGPPLGLPKRVGGLNRETRASFARDRQTLLTEGRSIFGDVDSARLWDLALLPDDPERVALWLEVMTGLTMEESGHVHGLDAVSYRERWDSLERLGGPPSWPARWSLDPILAGAESGARAREWVKRRRWAEAERVFDEAVRERPFNADLVFERGRFLLGRGQWSRADDDFIRAYTLGKRDGHLLDRLTDSEDLFVRACASDPGTAPRLRDLRSRRLQALERWAAKFAAFRPPDVYPPDDREWPAHLVLKALADGDAASARRARGYILEQLGTGDDIDAIDAERLNEIAWAAALTPGAVDRLDLPIRLAERAVDQAEEAADRGNYLNTLGAVLYRAGRFEAAAARLGEAIRTQPRRIGPQDWAFLAMAFHRLGQLAEARNWLGWFDLVGDPWPSTSPAHSWQDLEIRLLRSEAEAVILFDPVFPADPFAH
jgi:WD40 repeat protein/tetratricopeptide (TPR) repeat protein